MADESGSTDHSLDLARKLDCKSRLEFMRIATMIGQKIDYLWMTFLTTYVTLFGFAIFYDGGFRLIYFSFIVLATSLFTWINFRSLWSHYRLQNEMGRILKEVNVEFPSLRPLMAVYTVPKSEKILIYTHSAGFGMFVIFVFDKFDILGIALSYFENNGVT